MINCLPIYVILYFISYAVSFDYCAMNCSSQPHTACNDLNCGYHDRCNMVYETPLTSEERSIILGRLNFYRDRAALGIYKNPQASNMNEIVWKQELEYLAKCWSNNCEVGHDICRVTEEGETVGQNIIAFDDTLLEKGTMLMLQVAVDKWALERNILPLDEGLVNSYRKNKGKAENYTQMIWTNSKYVGCGRTTFKPGLVNARSDETTSAAATTTVTTEDSPAGGRNVTLLVCNFEPAGNIEGEQIYKIGEPCSSCENNCLNTSYGLCRSKYFNPHINDYTIRGLASETVGYQTAYYVCILLFIILIFQNA